jgi:uncharacterized membrane protein
VDAPNKHNRPKKIAWYWIFFFFAGTLVLNTTYEIMFGRSLGRRSRPVDLSHLSPVGMRMLYLSPLILCGIGFMLKAFKISNPPGWVIFPIAIVAFFGAVAFQSWVLHAYRQ